MRKISLIVATASALISAPVMAQNVMYACQYLKSGGLIWENKQWRSTGFKSDPPFFLSTSNATLNTDSVAKAFGGANVKVFCHEPTMEGLQSCVNIVGEGLIFDFNTMNGGVSRIVGATQSNNATRRDTLSVEAFTCTKM